MKNNVVRTRYAPSPTGFFHIGGARTALFNYLFAKSHEGIFVVRIEDTDMDRNVLGGIESQLDNLKWLKLFFDESPENPGLYGPYVQSEKLDVYNDYILKLINFKKAYKCFCTKDDLLIEKNLLIEKKRTPKYSKKCLGLSPEEIESKERQNIPWTVRIKIEENEIFEWNDLIRGKISVSGSSMSDLIIFKTDKNPTYNFSAAIDDHEMQISHVLRGEEHISNTPYQIAISKSLKINNDIKYGHLSLIIDFEKKKLSKRNLKAEQFIEEYHKMGFLPEAIVNYMVLLGWSPKDNIEIKSLNELIQEFDIKNVSSSPSTFDFEKMVWVNKEYIKKMNNVSFVDFSLKFIEKKFEEIDNINEILLAHKDQISYASQFNKLIENFFTIEDISLNFLKENGIEINLDIQNLANDLEKEFSVVEDWTIDAIEEVLKSIQEASELKGKNLFLPLRLATTSKKNGIEIKKIIWLYGKKNVMINIKNFKEKLMEYNIG